MEEVYGGKNRKASYLHELFIKNCNWSWQAVRVLVKHVSAVIQNGWIACCWVGESCPTLERPWTVARQTPPSMGFPRQEYWRGLPFPSPGDLPNSGIEPTSPALSGGFLSTKPSATPPGKFGCIVTRGKNLQTRLQLGGVDLKRAGALGFCMAHRKVQILSGAETYPWPGPQWLPNSILYPWTIISIDPLSFQFIISWHL